MDEQPLGRFGGVAADAAADTALDSDCDRGVAGLFELSVVAQLIAEEEGLAELYRGHGYGRPAALGSANCDDSVGEIHLRQRLAAENIGKHSRLNTSTTVNARNFWPVPS